MILDIDRMLKDAGPNPISEVPMSCQQHYRAAYSPRPLADFIQANIQRSDKLSSRGTERQIVIPKSGLQLVKEAA